MVKHHEQRPQLWGVLLAGGDGTRLQPLTAKIEGDSRPKQFCHILDGESLLSGTRRRISPVIHAERTIAVVNRNHESFYEPELRDLQKASILAQPENRGTGIAMAATLLAVPELGLDDIVAFFPCDHYYYDAGAFLNAVDTGVEAAQGNPDAIVLLGAEPTYPETDYGWIEPGVTLANSSGFAVAQVRQVWEKPAFATARQLMQRGCLWNTFVLIGRAGAFIDALSAADPKAMLALSAGGMSNDLDLVYRSIAPIDFSHDVLALQQDRLLVVRDALSGWTDLGRPSRVFDTVARQGLAPSWLESIDAAHLVAPNLS